MEITSDALPWDDTDVAAWLSFLSTKTGKRLLPKVLESTPELMPSGDVNAVLIRSGEVRGYQDFARQLLLLTTVTKDVIQETATNYPSLVDDSKWADGEQIKID